MLAKVACFLATRKGWQLMAGYVAAVAGLPELRQLSSDLHYSDLVMQGTLFLQALVVFTLLLHLIAIPVALERRSALLTLDLVVGAILVIAYLTLLGLVCYYLLVPAVQLPARYPQGPAVTVFGKGLRQVLAGSLLLSLLYLIVRASASFRRVVCANKWYHQLTALLALLFYPVGIFFLAGRLRSHLLRQRQPEIADHLLE